MRKCMFIFVPLVFSGALLAEDPFTGTWKLDPSQSNGDAIPRDETVVILDTGNTVHVTVKGTDADGMPIAVTYVVPITGGDGQMSQGPYDAVSETPINDNTRDVTYGQKGKRSKHHHVVSKDGKTMTVTNSGQDAQGNSVNSTEVYHKVDNAH
jgi:hypothetical protein